MMEAVVLAGNTEGRVKFVPIKDFALDCGNIAIPGILAASVNLKTG
jgi:hypothetical protein